MTDNNGKIKKELKKLKNIIAKLRNKFGNESIELIDTIKKKNALNQLDDVNEAIDKADSLEELKEIID